MTNDIYATVGDSLIAPARVAFSIVPNDTEALGVTAKALYVGTGGDVAIRAAGSSSDVVLRNVASGSLLPIRVSAVRIVGTTAANIVGLA